MNTGLLLTSQALLTSLRLVGLAPHGSVPSPPPRYTRAPCSAASQRPTDPPATVSSEGKLNSAPAAWRLARPKGTAQSAKPFQNWIILYNFGIFSFDFHSILTIWTVLSPLRGLAAARCVPRAHAPRARAKQSAPRGPWGRCHPSAPALG